MKGSRFVTLFFILLQLTTFGQQHTIATDDLIQSEKQQYSNYLLREQRSVASANYDVYFYRCAWMVDPAVRFISGSVIPYFTITASTSSIVFDLSNALTVDSVLYRGSKINFMQTSNDGLQINFPASLPAAQKDSVSIYYRGTPPNNGFGSFTQSTHNGVPVLWTLSEPYGAHEWWPCKDVLNDKADSIDILITYPADYRSSSNGLPVRQTTTGDAKTDYWQHRYPVAAYLVAFAVTNYVVDEDLVMLPGKTMPVVLYAYPESIASFRQATTVAKAGLQKFSELIEEYPFSKERYAQTQFGWGGGMEHQTNSFITAPGTRLVAHELAHQWFGDKVTCGSWQDLWLNEGFATYMELIYTQFVEQANVLPILQSWRNSIISSPGGSVFVTDTTNINRLFSGRLTYNKGGYLVHMLRWKLGDSTFFRGLRRYLNDPALRYKTARTTDLQRNLEQVSGQNLTEFFNDWFYGEGFPNYTAEWSQRTNHTVQVKLEQTTSHPSVSFYEMPVPLQFRSAIRDTTVIVPHSRSGQIFSFALDFLADTLLIDPQLWILAGTKATRKTTVKEFTEVTVFPNPTRNTLFVYVPAMPSQRLHLRLVNALGQQVYTTTVVTQGDEQLEIPVRHLASGIYWLQAQGETGTRFVKKVLVLTR